MNRDSAIVTRVTRVTRFVCLSAFRFCLLLFVLNASGLSAQERRRWDEPQNIGIVNTAGDDFAPAFNPQERLLYFTSTDSGVAEFYTTRYETRRDAATGDIRPRFQVPERVTSSLNQIRTNQSYITFANDGNILLSAFRMTASRPFLNIFQAAQRGMVYTKPEPVDVLNTDDFNAHPALSPSGRTVVFTSVRSGGRGGTDLWIANRDESGTWQVPVNMGDGLNSTENEITPCFSGEDSLYFASNGFGGKGGFEIFLTIRSEGKWQAPLPIVELNSEYDDSDCAMLPGGVAVFASNRAGTRGGLDLYVSRLVSVAQRTSSAEYKIATQTAFITLEEFAMTDVIPLAPCIFFEPNSGNLPRDLRQRTEQEANTFAIQNVRPDPMVVYTETLNIIGRRMQEFSDADVRLAVADGSNSGLARTRMNTLKTYLQNVWSIDSKRIVTQTTSSDAAAKRTIVRYAGEDAVRCVEITSSDSRVCAPVRIAGVNVLAKPRRLDIALDMRPKSVLRSWNVLLTSNGTSENGTDVRDTLLRTNGVTLPFATALQLDAGIWSFLPDELQIRLAGVDSLGRSGKHDLVLPVYRLPLEQKRTQKVQDKIIDRYRFLIPQDSDPSMQPTPTMTMLSADQQNLARDIVREITAFLSSAPTANALTLNLAPSSFGEKIALTSAERFARAVADELRRQAGALFMQVLQVEPVTQTLIPETPQERLFARSITLTVERIAPQNAPQERRGR
jgi:WD40-like Beta Propeller Repeat